MQNRICLRSFGLLFWLCLAGCFPFIASAQEYVLEVSTLQIKVLNPAKADKKPQLRCEGEILGQCRGLAFLYTRKEALLTIHIDISDKGNVSKTRMVLQNSAGKEDKIPADLKNELNSIFKSACFQKNWEPAEVMGKKVNSTVTYRISFVEREPDIFFDLIPEPPPPVPVIQIPDVAPPPPPPKPRDTSHKKEDIFINEERQPQFRGGDDSLKRYIDRHFVKPADAVKYDIVGRVLISFIVNEDGTLSDVKPLLPKDKQLGYGIEEVLVELVQNMPLWTPGYQRDKPVKVRYTLPVMIK
jgi:hypothetical protein